MIEITGLEKRFGSFRVLRGVNLTIRQGRVTALVGPNGSGKTTLMKCILGLVKPTRGTISINGKVLDDDFNYRRLIGYMPQVGQFPDNLRASEVLDLVVKVRGHNGRLDHGLSEQFRLNGELRKRIRTLSGGTRQKLSAVIAFMFQPAYYILDEPTAGLDPLSSRTLKEIIRERTGYGATTVVSSHIMSEVEQLCDDVVFLFEGRIYFAGTTEQLKEKTKQTNLEKAVAALMEQASV
jgi:Cu-processing system ATP-binding protein